MLVGMQFSCGTLFDDHWSVRIAGSGIDLIYRAHVENARGIRVGKQEMASIGVIRRGAQARGADDLYNSHP